MPVCRRSTEQTAEPRVTKFVTGIQTFGGWELPESRGIHSCLSVCRRSTEQTAEPRVTKFVTGIHTFGGVNYQNLVGSYSCLSVDDYEQDC
ncbi:hypothetical protein AVEN_229225-1 [Araneus ventricosus]|uniref:Uncharacterized protein n=1 Tax=Araneus ventricosus TaxID=182803 RepID=A0A4Y2UD05_ARAVE|nr:hypothetical protein AVEN_229225-1 [Araneus ventricosus]